ncbi:hypothetical protein [Chitinimonas sp. BJB300]|uniref:hypothetical protein n=1 Tax=Chitinimonas sp. BJB300 TaxID=1559339 RepID=UPI000C0CC552|nr:hypothetical protein [Chitinimonas sp. BJB300]PHV11675.1 hypothetical protein CSQ89_09765 [Chitinimonas sp. BJB300]TSJ85929.1 hypothetical protein FG002_017070 [Chitinimonas sp. BJB300]
MQFNRKVFFTDWSARTNLSLTPERQAAVTALLDLIEADPGFAQIREIAYFLATVRWESNHTFAPIKEKRFNSQTRPREWASQNVYWQTGFYGRGLVQITWEVNYRKASKKLAGMQFKLNSGSQLTLTADSLVQQPDLTMELSIAYAIGARGMREGWFTGKKLSDYIKPSEAPDYAGARRIINGVDRKDEIAAMAAQFELLLRAAASA